MTDRSKPIKLEDLARKLSVSKVTISKALRNHSDISVKMRSKVKELADKLGYTPDFMAKNLSSKRSKIIGVVVPKIAHFFFASVIESIYETALENDYEIVLMVSQEMAERERKHILTLLSMRVDGLIVSITQETKDLSIFRQVQSRNVPLVFIDRVPDLKNVPSVTVDDKGGAYYAVEYFIKKGIKKIGHIGGYRYINIGKQRFEGFIEAMRHNKVSVNQNWIIEGGFGEEDGYRGFLEMHSRGSLPSAILAVSYPVALGINEAALDKGLRIPDNFLVTCFGNNNFQHLVPSMFNFVDQPTIELGKEAVNLVLNILESPKKLISKNIQLKTKLLLGGNGQRSESLG